MVIISGPGVPAKVFSSIKATTRITFSAGATLVVLANRVVLGAIGAGAQIASVRLERQDQGGTWRALEDTSGVDYNMKTADTYTIWHGSFLTSDGVKLRFNNAGVADATDFAYIYVEEEIP